jgi:tRNA (guanosine-2'-O-)-methyltransferase
MRKSSLGNKCAKNFASLRDSYKTIFSNNGHDASETIAPQTFDDRWSFLSDDEVQRAIVAVSQYCSVSRQEKMESILNRRTSNVRFVFENPSNAGNTWAALRSFDSFGIQCVDYIFDARNYTADWSKTSSRRMHTALGSQQWLSLNEYTSTKNCLTRLKTEGYIIAATDLGEGSLNINEIDWNSYPSKKFAVVMGNEKNGISATAKQHSDVRFFVPTRGFAASLNLSAASAVICSILDQKGLLIAEVSESQRARIMLTWLCRSVSGSLAVLRRAGLDCVVGNYSLHTKIGTSSSKT